MKSSECLGECCITNWETVALDIESSLSVYTVLIKLEYFGRNLLHQTRRLFKSQDENKDPYRIDILLWKRNVCNWPVYDGPVLAKDGRSKYKNNYEFIHDIT